MIFISSLFLIFIFSIQTIEATGPKDLNPEKTKADANLSQNPSVNGAKNKVNLKKDKKINLKKDSEKTKTDSTLSQSSAVNPGETKKLSLKEMQALLKDIILEDASSSADLTDPEIQAIKLQVAINDFIPQGFKIIVQDNQLQAAGALKDFIANRSKIEVLLNEAEFIERIMEAIKAEHKLTGKYSYSLNMLDADTGSFEIYFYKSPEDLYKDLVKLIILEDASSSEDLTNTEIQAIKLQVAITENDFIPQGLKITVQDDQLQADGPLKDFIANPEKITNLFDDTLFKNTFFEKLKTKSPYLDASFKIDIKIINKDDGEFIISVYQIQSKEEGLKKIILEEASSSEDLTNTDIQAIKLQVAITENDFIPQGLKIRVQDDQLQADGSLNDFIANPEKITNLFDDTLFKNKLFEKLQTKNPYLDASFKIDIKIINKDDGEFIISVYQIQSKEEGLKKIILEDASSSADLTNRDIRAIKLKEVAITDFIPQGFKIRVQDNQLQANGPLKDFIENPNKIKALLNEAEFIEKIMEAISPEHKVTGEYSYSLNMLDLLDPYTGSFEIYFYKNQADLYKDLVKQIILEDASSSEDLTDTEIQAIKLKEVAITDFIPQGFKIRVQDDQLQADGPLKDFIANPNKIEALLNEAEFIEKIMEAISPEHKLTGEYSYSLNMEDSDTGAFEIYFYKNAAKSLKSMIIADLENCRDLDKSEIDALKADDKIYDKYISQACEILIEDRNLANLIGENKVESLKDTDYKQELADGLNKPNLNLDKLYFKVQDMTQGQIRVILADTKTQKLIKILKGDFDETDQESKKAIEEAYGVQYINLGISLYWYDEEDLNTGGEFYQSFALIDKILKNNTDLRTSLIKKANKDLLELEIKQTIPNDANTILRSRLNDGDFTIDIFTLTETPEEAIKSSILDWIDLNLEYSDSSKNPDWEGIEEERSLTQGIKFESVLLNRLQEGGSLSSYYNSEAMNILLDDTDFKRKVINKINDYLKEEDSIYFDPKIKSFSNNLDDIKIKALNFNYGDFELVVYELEPK